MYEFNDSNSVLSVEYLRLDVNQYRMRVSVHQTTLNVGMLCYVSHQMLTAYIYIRKRYH
jgi:hypothetical protein